MGLATGAPSTERTGLVWRRSAYLFAVVSAVAVAYYVAHIPIQVSDSLGNLLQIQGESHWRLFVSSLFSAGYVRPLLWTQMKLASDLAQGHYWLMFKGIHAAQLVLTGLLFVRLLRVRDAGGCAAMGVGIAVLFGLHTFNGTVREAFPINTFLTILVCVLAAANLSTSRPRLVNDIAAILLLVFALLTVESGMLVVVAVCAGRLAGLRGVSKWGVIACVLLTGAYLDLRFRVLAAGVPSLLERSSGYGLGVLEPPELLTRFGDNPYPFYAYNVMSSVMTVLFSEPRNGVWDAVRRVTVEGEIPPWLIVNISISAATTTLAAVFLWGAWRRWQRAAVTYEDRVAVVAVVVILANAAISFAYTKDVIMSVGGAFFALLAAIAFYDAMNRMTRMRPRARVAVVGALVIVSTGWAVRASSLPFLLRQTAFDVRNDWAVVYQWLDAQHIELKTEAARALVDRLRTEALTRPLPHPDIGRPAYVDYLDLN